MILTDVILTGWITSLRIWGRGEERLHDSVGGDVRIGQTIVTWRSTVAGVVLVQMPDSFVFNSTDIKSWKSKLLYYFLS